MRRGPPHGHPGDGPPYRLPPPHGEWGPYGPPPGEWGPRGPPPPAGWGPRGPPPPEWGPPHGPWAPPSPGWEHPGWGPKGPDPWGQAGPPPPEWGPHPPAGWGLPPPDGWGPGGPPPEPFYRPPSPDPFGPFPGPPAFAPPPPPVAYPPTAYPPPVEPPPPASFPSSFPPPGWTGEPMVNPPPEQPQWLKALISVPPSDPPVPSTDPPAPSPAPVAAAKPAAPSEPAPKAKPLGLLGKRVLEKPPAGRSTGIISFIGPTYGYIEREDLKKFYFKFNAYFGNSKALMPGVRVHYTALKEKGTEVATDVKVAPGGTENVGLEIYEAVVSQPIQEVQPGEKQYPGQVVTTLGHLRTNLPYERRDSSVTLLKNDHVLFNLLTDLVTDKRRAINLKLQIPLTFSHTMETRETGVISSIEGAKGVIRSEKHGELAFDLKENLSDVDLTQEDVKEEVEFTVHTVRGALCAVRIRRVKEPLLLTLCTSPPPQLSDLCGSNTATRPAAADLYPDMQLDPELYEGIVSQNLRQLADGQPARPGQIFANIGPIRTNVTFDRQDCSVTLLKDDHVLINLLMNTMSHRRRATNIRPKVPFTFSYTKEKRLKGHICSIKGTSGDIRSEEYEGLPFDVSDTFSDNEFGQEDVGEEVEFTVITVSDTTKAVRLRRMVPVDKILEEQKKREVEEKKKREEERKKKEEEEEEEKSRELEKRREAAAALAAAKDKWTPLGFKMTDPKTFDDISKERFDGTVLKTISKSPQVYQISKDRAMGELDRKDNVKEEKKEPNEEAEVDRDKKEGVLVKQEGVEAKQEVGTDAAKLLVKQEQEDCPVESKPAGGKEQDRPDRGRLVMTIAGEQKILHFGPEDVITRATMMVGDKVRFKVATQRESKEERATYVEILPDSFQESTEQRRNGIVIEFSEDTGLIKCSQNPQLFFRMSEVIVVKHKKLELNEKVEFSVVPHETAEGGHQAIRITRFMENVFLPVRKLGAVVAGAPKGKLTIKLSKETTSVEATGQDKADTDKLKAVVKNLRSQDNKDSRGSGVQKDSNASRRRYGRSRSRSRSPSRTHYGRYIERRRSPSIRRSSSRDRSHRRSRSRERGRDRSKERGRDRSKEKSRDRSKERARDRSKERGRDRSKERGRDRSKERGRERSSDRSSSRTKSTNGKEREKRGSAGGVVVDDELAWKKWELEKLNEMIAYRKSLVERDSREGDPRGGDPRGVDPGQRTCIDYDHGRIAVPLKEYKSVLRHREDSEDRYRSPSIDPERAYHGNPYDGGYRPQPSADPYRDRFYGDYPYEDRLYGDARYADRPYDSRSYGDQPHSDRPPIDQQYGEQPYPERPYSSGVYRYDLHDEQYAAKSRAELPYDPPPAKHARTLDPHGGLSTFSTPQLAPPQSSLTSGSFAPSTQPQPSFRPTEFRPQSPVESPTRSPSPRPLPQWGAQPSTQSYNPLLEIFNKGLEANKKRPAAPVRSSPYQQTTPSEPHSYKLPDDDLLPHERAIQDGSGFSRIVGLASEQTASSRYRSISPKTSSLERTNEEEHSSAQPFDKFQHLLRSIGMKLSTGSASKLGGPAPQSLQSREEFSSAEREPGHSSAQKNKGRPEWIGSTEARLIHSPSPARAPSTEPRGSIECEYEGFLDQQELEALQKAKEMQSLTKTIGHPSTQFQPKHPASSYTAPTNSRVPAANTESLSCMASTPPPSTDPLTRRYGTPPGHSPGSPPHYVQGFPTFGPSTSSTSSLPFLGQEDPDPISTVPMQGLPGGTKIQTSGSFQASLSTPVLTTSAELQEPNSAITVARCLKVIETVKALKPSKSVQFSLPSEQPVSSVQIAGGTEEDIRAKQKEKLDQYNQRMQDKRELQYKEIKSLRKQGFGKKPPTVSQGKPIGDPKSVWICGHSLVYWAESRAKSPEVGMQLGMDPSNVTIHWKGTQGMTWPQLLPLLHQLKVKWPNPDVLIMHLGGNDLSTESPTDLLASVKKDLGSMRSIFPNCLLVWSNILPRRVWRHSDDSHEVDLVRTTVNRRIHNIILDLGGTSLTHDNIRCGSNTGQYRANGVHLSSKGIDTFNLNLQDFLEKWEMESVKDVEKP